VAIVLAAGASTRMKSETSKLLKEVLGRPVIHWAFDQAFWAAEKILMVVGHQREAVMKALDPLASQAELRFAVQAEPKGTGHAVQCALAEMDGLCSDDSDIFIMGGDCLLLHRESLEAFLRHHESQKASLSVMTNFLHDPGAYGRIIRGPQGEIEAIVELKDATPDQLGIREVNPGFYLVRFSVLKEALQNLDNRNKAGEFYLTDLVSYCRKKGLLISTFEIRPEEGLGINTQSELALVERLLRNRVNEWWMSQGVRMMDPATTWIDSDVQLAADVVLEPGVILRGKTQIRKNVRIGAYSVVENSEIQENSVVQAYSHISGARLGIQTKVGPFVRLRAGTILDKDVHIGNFVEVKKSHLHEGVKAGHLSYLGDAVIGKDSNIGAGTITCNYDGFSKHETKLGANVFVGSNSSLVAPLEVGEGAIIGAGSVVTKKVSPQAVVIERSEQREILQGAARMRERKMRTKKG